MEGAVILLAIFAAAVLLAFLSIRKSAKEPEPASEFVVAPLSQPPPEAIAANKDPRLAAAILLYQAAALKGDISDETDSQLLNGMAKLFNTDSEASADLFSAAWRALGERNDTGVALDVLVGPIVEQCTDIERREFLSLFQRISTLEGAPNPQQMRLFEDLRARLL